MEGSIFFGNSCHNGLMPAVARPAMPSVHSALGMKPFLPFPMDNVSAAVRLFPRFNASQVVAHYKGTRHGRKPKAPDAPKTRRRGSAVAKETGGHEAAAGVVDDKEITPALLLPPVDGASPAVPDASETTSAAGTDEGPSQLHSPAEPDLDPDAEPEKELDPETEEEKAKRLLYCSLCKVAVNSASQLEAHNSGTKHKTMLEARSGVGCIKSFPRAAVKGKLPPPSKTLTGLQNKTFHCETCDVHVNSETQLKQHISSRRHKDRAAGKPAKPKYSPYSKPHKGTTKQMQVKLTLGKERPCPPLAAQLLPAHLAAMAAAISNTFAHRAPRGVPAPALFQTQPLHAALLRPAPGPVRTSHPQLLFAPY
ncbi:zinc finger protein 385D isoform X1 [Nerophis lumbriciformis]|uniref:zinc finger protein 385D isoform X1 n=1 Tax=Nerophis lumbriciformis TaxID=546530 RepID=UPI002ADF1259|nr:zinc finger protein 385D-like isoform X1 [Nerophis lumbriciformis]